MNAQRATGPQIGFIHGLAKKAKMDEDMRRGFLMREAGVDSTKKLTAAQASDIIRKLQPLAGNTPKAKGAVAGLDTPVARKLRALWIAGHDLGLVRDRTDQAMLSFLERQTDVSHTRFLTDPGQATAAIEALKAMLERDAGVLWPSLSKAGPTGRRVKMSIAEQRVVNKRAILDAQWRRLQDLADVCEFGHPDLGGLERYAVRVASINGGFRYFEAEHYDAVQAALGKRLRGALARKSELEAKRECAA